MGQNALRNGACIFLICIILCAAGSSFAEELTEGIRFGVFSIHPSMYTALRYDDNVYFVPNNYRPENDRSIPQDIESDMVLNVMPAITFNLTWPTFLAKVGYRFYNDTYLGTDDPDNRHDDLNATNHNYSGLLDYNAPFGLMVGARDDYSIMETYEETDQFADYLRGSQIHNEGSGWLGYRHGPEDNLFIRAAYTNILDQYDEYEEFDKMGQYVDGELRLKFFPLTALVAQGGYGMIDYDSIQAYDSTNWWAKGGLQGQITTHLIMTIKGGWAAADYQENEDLGTWLADAELTAMFPSQTQLTGGYRHYWRDATNTNYFITHEGYLRFTRLWGSRLLTSAFGSYQYNEFSEPLPRHEDFVQGSVDVTFRFVYWLFIGGGYKIEHKLYDDDDVRETSTRNVALIHLQAQF